MDLTFTDEQEAIREVACEFAEKKLAPIALEMDEIETIPEDVFDGLREGGFFGLTVPEEYDGLGADLLSYLLAIEELSKASASVAICLSVHCSLACAALSGWGTDEQKQRYLPRMATGELIGAYSLTEPGAGSDAAALKTSAVVDGDSYVLNGNKLFVTNGGYAGLFIIFAKTDAQEGSRGITAFLVERDTPGLEIGKKEHKMGLKPSDTRELALVDCRVSKTQVLGELGGGFKIALKLLDHGRLGVSAQATGIAKAALSEAISYSKVREQFGRPICKFQAIAFMLSEMSTEIDAAEALWHRAAWIHMQGEGNARVVSEAKLFSTWMANRVVHKAVQIHGGYGYIKEYAVERYFRDARVTELYEGTSEIQKLVILRALLRGS
jgi:alkylation response protein AidB-like acyl-CoA dehydrogenase